MTRGAERIRIATPYFPGAVFVARPYGGRPRQTVVSQDVTGVTPLKHEGCRMQCPIDGTNLVMTDKQGIEVDYCPKCRGVWMDRGELDKIIERSMQVPNEAPAPQHRPASPSHDRYSEGDRYDSRHDSRGHDPRYRKRKSFLGEIFDFD
jgi:uncharacterized protein